MQINIYTDGACSGNPGPAGIGVCILYGINKNPAKTISMNIGNGTNNIAELSAIKISLEYVIKNNDPNKDEIIIYTDSQYCIGALSKNWKIKTNEVLIITIKRLISQIKNIKFIKVKGHSISKYNNIADKLAVKAIN